MPHRFHHAVTMTSSVQVVRDGAVTVVTIDRPGRRNAVDPATAEALLDAFTAFDADDSSSVAVLTGSGGTFCAGADLKALAGGARHRVAPDGPGPMGPTRLELSKPVHRRRRGVCRGRWPGAGHLVRPAGGGRRRRLRRVLSSFRCTPHRRRNGPAPPHDRPGPRPRPDPHRPGGGRRGGAGHGTGGPGRPRRDRPRPRRRPRTRAGRTPPDLPPQRPAVGPGPVGPDPVRRPGGRNRAGARQPGVTRCRLGSGRFRRRRRAERVGRPPPSA